MTNNRMKKYIVSALLFMTAVLCLLLCACEAPWPQPDPATEETRNVRVVLAEDEGIEFGGERIRSVEQGSSLALDYTVKDGYIIERTEGAELGADGKYFVPKVNFPTTVVLKTRLLEHYQFETAVSDFGDGVGDAAGKITISSEECREGDTITLNAIPSADFAFLGFSEGAPLEDGGTLISTEREYSFIPEKSAKYYANFDRAYGTVTVENTPGLIFRTNNEVRAAVGSRIFVSVDFEEGYVFDGADEGLTVDGKTLYAVVGKPATYSVKLHLLTKYDVSLEQNIAEGGTATVEPDKKYGWEGDTVVFKATLADSYVFNGFSEGATLDKGGKLLTTDREIEVTLDRNMKVFANFEFRTYTVKLNETEGIRITSEKEVTVPAGSSAHFTFEVIDGYAFDAVIGADYADGVITLSDVFDDREITVECHELSAMYYEFGVNSPSWGSVSSSLPEGFYKYGTRVTLTATPGKGGFEGFKAGGKTLSTSTTFTLTITDNINVIATFREPPDPAATIDVPKDKWVILYHPNGGTGATAGLDYYREEQPSNTLYHCPNAMPNTGKFTRSGYTLLGYNTKEDGSGTFYAPGWNVVMPERGAISLWCVWEKESPASDFKYKVSSDTKTFQYSKATKLSSTKYVTITGYKGSDKTVVIPERIDGYPVTNIAAAAFTSNQTMETLVLPRLMFGIADSAVVSCPNFKTLRICNSVQSMSDTWYVSCPNLQTFIISAIMSPTYASGRNGTYAVKFDWLMTAPGKKICIVSGSNSAYGINSPMLEELLANSGYKYSVVNYGQNASTPAAFYIEVISNFINPGDILLVEPEMNKYQLGYNEINSTLWQIFEGAFDAYSLVDTRHYVKLYSTFAAFNKACSTRTALTYETFTSDTVNAWGDYSLNKVGATSSWKTTLDGYDANGGKSTTTFKTSTDILTKNASYSENGRTLHHVDEINRAYDMVTAKGGTVLLSFAAIVRTGLTLDSQEKDGATQKNYMAAVDKYLHATRISVVSNYIFEREYSYNSNYHLNTAGQTVRTQKISADLVAYFKKK